MKRFIGHLLIISYTCFGSSSLLAQWVQTNGPEGGYIHSVTTDDSYIYAATFGPIFRMGRNDSTWVPLHPQKDFVFIARSLIFSGTTLVAGTDGGGVYRSTDHGGTFRVWNSGLHHHSLVSSFAVHGGDLFAATDRGVYLSTDHGANWTPRNKDQDSILVVSLLVRDSCILAGTLGNGVYRSLDYGESWDLANNGLTSEVVWSLVCLDTTILAGTWWESEGIYRSTNNGSTWVPIPRPPVWNSDVNAIAILDTFLFAATHGGVFKSSDTGENWTLLDDDPGSVVNCFHVNDEGIFAGTYNGVYFSSDTGENWRHASRGLIAVTINELTRNNAYLFAGTEFSGLFRSDDDGDTWIRTKLISKGVTSLLCSGTDLFAGTQGGSVYLSKDNGDSWTTIFFAGKGPLRITGLAAIGSDLFVGTFGRGVFLSKDNGESWNPVNEGLTDTMVSCLAVRGTNIYAGTEKGMFFSPDYGTSWSPYNMGLTDIKILCLAASQGNLLAGTESGGVFISTDEGSDWIPVNTGLSDLNIQCLASGNTKVFAGTSDNRIFMSENNGSSWHNVNEGLKNLRVLDLDIGDKNLFAGTSGSGVWRRPLSEMNISSGIDHLVQGSILTYPNPADSWITVQFHNPAHESYRLSIIDPSGKIMYHLDKVNSDRVEMNLDYLEKGFYIIQLTGPRIFQDKLILK